MEQPLRIAVADDEPDMQYYLERILPRLGHISIGTAGNGRDLVDLCRQLVPDLVITDIRMPVMDGIDAACQINALHPTPVILVSAQYDPTTMRRMQSEHIMACLLKPVRQSDLAPAIALAAAQFRRLAATRQMMAARRVAQSG